MSYVSLSWSDLDNMDKGQLRRAWRNSNSHQRLVIEKYVNETYPPGAAEAMIREYHRTLHRKSVANDPSRKRQTRSSLQRIETEAREGFAQEPTGVLRALAAQLPYGAMKAMIEDELTRRKHRRDPSRGDARTPSHLARMKRDARTFTVARLKSIVRTSKKAHARKIARAELRRRGH